MYRSRELARARKELGRILGSDRAREPEEREWTSLHLVRSGVVGELVLEMSFKNYLGSRDSDGTSRVPVAVATEQNTTTTFGDDDDCNDDSKQDVCQTRER